MNKTTQVIKLDLSELPRSDAYPDVQPYTEEQMGHLVAAEAAKITHHWTKNYPDNKDLQECVKGAVSDVLGILDGAAGFLPGFELTPFGYKPTVDVHGSVWPRVPFGGNIQTGYERITKKGLDKCELFVSHYARVEDHIKSHGFNPTHAVKPEPEN